MRATVTTTKKDFLRRVASPDFVDLVVISPESAICIMDGIQVNCRNLPHIRSNYYLEKKKELPWSIYPIINHDSLILFNISAWTYSYSKLLMMQTWHYMVERYLYYLQGHLRLGFSDFLSTQREENTLETMEKQELLTQGMQIPFETSLTAFLDATAFTKTFGRIIDWSSIIHDDSVVYNTIVRPSPSVSAQVAVVVINDVDIVVVLIIETYINTIFHCI